MNRVSIPAVLLVATVLAVIMLLIGYMPLDANRARGYTATNSQSTDWRPAPTEYPGEKGRWVVMLGDVEMRIPKDRRTQTPASTYDIYPEALCLREQDELADCFENRDRIQIYLMARPPETPQPECNLDRDYSDGALNGPFATANAEVDLYQTESKTTRRYVYREAGEACRQPTANCNAVNCISSFIPHSGVSIRYQFDEGAIGNWPTVHQRVRDHVMPLFAWR